VQLRNLNRDGTIMCMGTREPNRRRTSALALVATALLLSAGLPATAAAGTTDLGKAGFGTIVVDDSRQHVFVSGPKVNAVYELDLSGNLIATVANVYGAWGMTINGNYLYVAESTAGAIVRIDLTSSPLSPATVTTGLNGPRWLVMTGGALWTTSGGGGGEQSKVVSVDPTTGVTTPLAGTYYEPDLAVSPGDPNTLFIAQDGLSPGSVYRIDVSTSPPKQVAYSGPTEQSNIQDLAVSPDGTRVIPASGAPYLFAELSASTLGADGVRYPAEPYPKAVAVSASGLLATSYGAFRESTLEVFHLGTPAASFMARCNLEVPPHGLALSSDGSRLFAVGFANEHTGYVGEHTLLTTVFSGCTSSPPPLPPPPTQPTQPPSQPTGSAPPPPVPTVPLPPHLQFAAHNPRPGRPDLYLELDAFRLTLLSGLLHTPIGYRYFFAAQHIRCINGATNLIFTVAHARHSTSCRPGPILISGQLAPHSTYQIRVQAVRERKHKVVKWGASYSGHLYMPGNEARWVPIAQVPPGI
jgi:hypothetical protein